MSFTNWFSCSYQIPLFLISSVFILFTFSIVTIADKMADMPSRYCGIASQIALELLCSITESEEESERDVYSSYFFVCLFT